MILNPARALIVNFWFQYISGMAAGGQASNVSYSSVSQSSDGGICATGSALPSSGMWRHTSARTGPRRERAIRFRDAIPWVDASFERFASTKELKESFRATWTHRTLKSIAIKCSEMLQDYYHYLSPRDATGFRSRDEKRLASDARTTRMNE